MKKEIFSSLQQNSSLAYYNENRMIAKDGWELWFRWYGQPVYNNNEYTYLIGVGININEQKKSERELNNQVQIN